MDEFTKWIIGIRASLTASGIVGGITFAFHMSNKISKLDSRLSRVEAIMCLLNRAAAKALHSPHDPDGLDYYVEKYEKMGYDLPHEDWVKVHEICERILNDKDAAAGYRLAAGIFATQFVLALSKHKEMRFHDAGNKTPVHQ